MTLAENTRVVVVGAGIVGCCAAWHLLRAGVRNVTVADAVRPGEGTTSAGAGFVTHWSLLRNGFFGGRQGFQLQQYGLDFYRKLNSEGEDIGYRATGTLVLALTEAESESSLQPILNSALAPSGLRSVRAQELAEIIGGLVDPVEVHSAVYNPHGIQIETTRALTQLARQVRSLGGTVRSNVKIVGLEDHGTGVCVLTEAENLEADKVILAGGAWNNELLATIGYRIPLLRVLATRIITDNRGLPSTLPTVLCPAHGLWLRESAGAVTWGTTQGYSPLYRVQPSARDALPFGQPRYPQMLDRLLEQQSASLEQLFPPLRNSAVTSWSQGWPCYTPDHNLMLGRVPEHPAILVVGGDNETGLTHGPGLGRLLTEIVLQRPTSVDPLPFRLDRFDPENYPTEACVEKELARHSAMFAEFITRKETR